MNDDWQEKMGVLGEQTRSDTRNPAWTALGLNACLRGEKPVIKGLSYGTAYVTSN
jgi:hypothetical protein